MGTTSQTAEASEAHFCVPPLRNGALTVFCWSKRKGFIALQEKPIRGGIQAHLRGSSGLFGATHTPIPRLNKLPVGSP
jgi:hypothetical protein